MHIKEGTIWVKTITTRMVWTFHVRNDHFVYQTRWREGIIVDFICWWHGPDRKWFQWNGSTSEVFGIKIWNESPKAIAILPRIELSRSTKRIFLSQRKYVLDFLMRIRILACKPTHTPLETNGSTKKCLSMDSNDFE